MTEQRLMFIDIEPLSNSSAPVDDTAEKPLWTRTDNTFRFNFLPDNSAALQKETSSSSSDRAEPAASRISFTGQSSAFAFNFQIPSVSPVENMDTTESPDTSSPGSQQCIQEEKPSSSQEVNSTPEPSTQSKSKKKKKKSGKKPVDSSTEPQQKPSSAEGSQGSEDTELSAEEQLNRQLDWCIEQLELGMRSQKGTPKQKEEASRALKTLRSAKAPLAKKRQVMRAMNGDYRKKMEEEKTKQFKLIQSEMASAQVKVVSDAPKKCVFQRRPEVKTQTAATVENLQEPEAKDTASASQTQEETPAFVFTPSKEEFRFNFL
ncbi:UPF0488 protein C8orf33 homolog isoform X1 [Larimichthys crocea]|uniref:UPF0488 protein C8orf33 homolog isoform X1 n=2 Tax=Larimichthys crocea TaxID=215358 RepID=UPI000F5DAA07|nr:UPF0488 protein C8orf33 homolog isoform X1 [Larimichthys crocea]XP_027144893.1 UPF0488 protein C8orf33 homolog isoform X1 [Larimichthys crocea]